MLFAESSFGQRGDHVRAIQYLLYRRHNYPRLSGVTGYFGSITTDSIKDFQSKHGMSSTGRCTLDVFKAILTDCTY